MECPYCGSNRIKKNGKFDDRQRFMCHKKHTFFDMDDYRPSTRNMVGKLSKWWFK